MSLSNDISNPDASPSGSGASGIRLPPISFLSRNNERETTGPVVLPAGQNALENRQLQNDEIEPESSKPQVALSSREATENANDDSAKSLPTPQVLSVHAGSHSLNGNGAEPNDSAQLPDENTTAVQSRPDEQQTTDKGDSQQPDSHHRHHHHHHHHGPNKHRHHHHHHHHHHHKPHLHLNPGQSRELVHDQSEPDEPAESPAKKAKTQSLVTKEAIQELITEFNPERSHLGTIIYNPTTTWETLQIEQLHGLQEHDRQRLLDIRQGFMDRVKELYTAEPVAYIPVLPPLSEAYINSFVEVKIPYRFVKEFVLQFTAGKVQRKRELWGGTAGIYTDDSDLLSVLCHLGLFDDNLDLSETNTSWKKQDLVRPLRVQQDVDGVELLDLSVTILLLPTLKKYRGLYRNGLNSRTWDGISPHDGLSYSVYNVKWETYEISASERNLLKLTQKENLSDSIAERTIVQNGQGWQFNYKYYRELQAKYKQEESVKEETKVQNGA